MLKQRPEQPVVMCFSGLDPSGGAGIQADIEAIRSMGCHVTPLITAHTVQDTQQLVRYVSHNSVLLSEQARAVLDDINVHAFKLGMLGSEGIVTAIHSILIDYPHVPVVFDPVLAAGGGGATSDEPAIVAMRELLMPLTTVLTPNSNEARSLAPNADTLAACAEALQDNGCEYVLITGAHEATDDVVNTLYANHRRLEEYHWDRLPHAYHGSGCTLAASIAALLAHGLEPLTAVHEAQEYTWQALQHARHIGQGQYIPNRFFWADED